MIICTILTIKVHINNCKFQRVKEGNGLPTKKSGVKRPNLSALQHKPASTIF